MLRRSRELIVVTTLLSAAAVLAVEPRSSPLRLTTVSPFQFVTDFPLEEHQANALRQDLLALGRCMRDELGVPEIHGPVRIYIFEQFDGFCDYVQNQVPGLHLSRAHAAREGLFLKRNGRPYIFAFRSPALAEMLRHEFVHASLNAAGNPPPIWLDEGLAEYYKRSDPDKLDRDHLARLQRRRLWRWRPDLSRLATIQTMTQFTSIDYAESWSWIHLLMHGVPEGRQILSAYLAELRSSQPGEDLPAKPFAQPPDLVRHWQTHFQLR